MSGYRCRPKQGPDKRHGGAVTRQTGEGCGRWRHRNNAWNPNNSRLSLLLMATSTRALALSARTKSGGC